MKFPQEESGRQRKLSRPWHGPYRIISRDDPDLTVQKVYFPDDSSIQIHQSRVTRCPLKFPAGYYWYGNKRRGPERPPKWVNNLLATGEDKGTLKAKYKQMHWRLMLNPSQKNQKQMTQTQSRWKTKSEKLKLSRHLLVLELELNAMCHP